MIKSRIGIKKKLVFFMCCIFLVSVILNIRMFTLQVIQGKHWKEKAINQHYSRRFITAARGTIYDRTENNILALSSSVEMVTVNPMVISKEDKEKVAKALSEIFGLTYEKTLEKVNKKSSIETIIKKVDKSKTDLLRQWMLDNNIFSGINIDEDTKRFYPYSTLASHIIGFIGSDNQGLDGIEARYNDELTGINGNISRKKDGRGMIIGSGGEQLDETIQGKNIVLSIDVNIQGIVEKYLEDACIENKCTDGGNVIVMDPRSGDILAMATYPNYDLNNPYEISNDEIRNIWSEFSSQEKSNYLQSVWRNKAIADTYEPGSTFKLVTSSAAVEEKIAEPDRRGIYNCSGSIEIAGVRIKCWRYYRPHGSQSLREALMNSCNPVFIGLGQKIGVEKYYEYLDKFGFLKKTNIDLYGEARSIFLKKEKVGPVELATISFGQRFEVTPIQMITMASAIANGGIYVEPKLVKKVIDVNTGIIDVKETHYGDRVISKETSDKILSMMTSVVSEGTGKNARVEGYDIGGKTGTSEDGIHTGKYVTSFIGIAPTNNPKLTILVTLYNPTGEKGHQGGTVAAPVAGKILNEVIRYLEI